MLCKDDWQGQDDGSSFVTGFFLVVCSFVTFFCFLFFLYKKSLSYFFFLEDFFSRRYLRDLHSSVFQHWQLLVCQTGSDKLPRSSWICRPVLGFSWESTSSVSLTTIRMTFSLIFCCLGLFTLENQSPENEIFTVFYICINNSNRKKYIQIGALIHLVLLLTSCFPR